MANVIRLLALALSVALPAAAEEPGTAPPPARPQGGLTLADCVARAVAGSGRVSEAKGKLAEWQARLEEARSVWYPKLSGTAVAAPTFAVKGSVLDPDTQPDYTHWGPYLRIDALLVQPVYTFGRADAGEKAAGARVEVERNQVEVVKRAVAIEVARYYYLHLYAKGVQPTLESIRKTIDEAQAKAQSMFDAHSGGITSVDLMKLKVGATELEKFRVQAEIGAGLALVALKHTMGMAAEEPLALIADGLPADDGAEPAPLEDLVKLALDRRPETAQLRHGKKAAEELERMEGKGDLPVLALVGQLTAAWSPVRADATNPYVYDPYNEKTAGVGLAIKFDLDPWRTHARADGARGVEAQVDGLTRYAATGIPAEVHQARDEVLQARRLVALSQESSSAARRWMIFATNAYGTGTGETRDVLEGVNAYAQARKGYFDALLALHVARANLDLATGAPLP